MLKSKKSMRKSFNSVFYQKTGINNLILFSIYSITENQEKCTFEKLIQECFSQFPEIFSFTKYSQWPDARKVDRPLRTLRQKKLIRGDPQNFFSLTKTGKALACEISKTFRQRKLFK